MKNVFVNCTAKQFYEELKPLLLTLEGYTMYEDEWTPMNNGCRIHSNGHWFPFQYQANYTEIELAAFIASVRPKEPIDLSGHFITCTEEQSEEVCDMLDALGYKEWDSPFGAWVEEWSDGVYVFVDSGYLCAKLEDDLTPTLTVEELREIYKQVKQ